MRSLLRALAAIAVAVPTALAQAAPAGAQSPAAPPSASRPATTQPAMTASLRHDIGRLADILAVPHVPPADSFSVGPRTIPAGTTLTGDVGNASGTLDVLGHVTGSVYALDGDIVVHQGAEIDGDAIAVNGRVQAQGGRVDGEIRSLGGVAFGAAATPVASRPLTTIGALKLVGACFAVLFVIGVGVMVFAEQNFDGVVAVLERQFARAFWTGVLAELGIVPVLLLLVVALAVTVIGVLLIPFAVVAYIIALAGVLALALLAAARFTGRGLIRVSPDAVPRVVSMRALFTGLVLYGVVWGVVAALTWLPAAQPVLRAIALAVTWVALTAGLGAVVLSRAGTQRAR
ncbi:MAG TPA: polymer-forming cytoskeletal protein, partial [Gemmatimonadaceae bacterium]|nr:polymer-forming cytoskeletal protein [Gemmatimonadaceae bacterium]